MLVRVDALATPATAFEPTHRKVDAAILTSHPGSTALNLNQAFSFARQVQVQDGRGRTKSRLWVRAHGGETVEHLSGPRTCAWCP